MLEEENRKVRMRSVGNVRFIGKYIKFILKIIIFSFIPIFLTMGPP